MFLQVGTIKLQSECIDLLRQVPVQETLKLKAEQIKEIEDANSRYPTVKSLLAELGFEEFSQFGGLNLEQAKQAGSDFESLVASVKKRMDKRLEAILEPNQLERLKQIYLQRLMMSDRRVQIARDDLELGVSIDANDAKALLSEWKLADIRIMAETKRLRYIAYTDAMRSTLGPSAARTLLGDPFVVDLPAEPEPRRRRADGSLR